MLQNILEIGNGVFKIPYFAQFRENAGQFAVIQIFSRKCGISKSVLSNLSKIGRQFWNEVNILEEHEIMITIQHWSKIAKSIFQDSNKRLRVLKVFYCIRYIQRYTDSLLPTTPFSLVLRKEYFDISHTFKRGDEKGVCTLVLCSLATVMSSMDASVGPLLIFSIMQRGLARVQRGLVRVQRGLGRVQRGLFGSALAYCKAGPSSNLGSAPHGDSVHWADSCEDMECLWMKDVWLYEFIYCIV